MKAALPAPSTPGVHSHVYELDNWDQGTCKVCHAQRDFRVPRLRDLDPRTLKVKKVRQ